MKRGIGVVFPITRSVKSLCLLALCVAFMSCSSTGTFSMPDPSTKMIESRTPLNLPEECLRHEMFTTASSGAKHQNPNVIIANAVAARRERSITAPSLDVLLLMLHDTYGLVFTPSKSSYTHFFIYRESDGQTFCIENPEKNRFVAYTCVVRTKPQELASYQKLTGEYADIVERIEANNRMIQLCRTPSVEKVRQVPYTAYRPVTKYRKVTRWETVKVYEQGRYIEHRRPVEEMEPYTVQEAYTAYRTERYMEANPAYSPARAAELEQENLGHGASLENLARRIGGSECDFFTIRYND